MKQGRSAKAMSHLYLFAILPTLAEWLLWDEQARALIAPWDLRLRIGILGEPAVILEMRHGEMMCIPEGNCSPLSPTSSDSSRSLDPADKPRGVASIHFLFLTHRHLNAFFSGKKWALPLVTRGLWRIIFLKRFAVLADRLNTLLQDNTSTAPLYTRLVFLISGLGLLPLANYDRYSQAVLESIPAGLAEFSIDNDPNSAIWFENKKGCCTVGRGVAPRLPDVRVRFADSQVANQALRNDIDTLAAIGAQRIKIEGLAPLAEGLELLMKRLNSYLGH